LEKAVETAKYPEYAKNKAFQFAMQFIKRMPLNSACGLVSAFIFAYFAVFLTAVLRLI
jgi:hypothetical protein